MCLGDLGRMRNATSDLGSRSDSRSERRKRRARGRARRIGRGVLLSGSKFIWTVKRRGNWSVEVIVVGPGGQSSLSDESAVTSG